MKGDAELRTLKAMQRILTILVLAFISVGCSDGAYIGKQSSGNSPINNFYIDEKIGAD